MSTPAAPKRAVVYVRASLDRTGDGVAVARQEEACRALAVARGWEVLCVKADNSVSASTGKLRPAWEEVLAMIDAGAVDVVIAWHMDRITRSMTDLERLILLAVGRGVGVATATGDIDLTSDAGRMVARILAAVARAEVERKGARQRAANRQRAEGGSVLWTRRPFGFDREGRAVFVVEAEAAELRKVAADLLAGASVASVVRDLNARDVSTSLGGTWNTKTLKQVILNPRVAGRVVYRGEDMGAGGPAILDAETYDRLHALLTDPRRKLAPSTTVKYLLSGLVVCGRCAETAADGETPTMLATSNGAQLTPVYRCFACYQARKRDPVDEVVLTTIAARLARPDAAQLLNPEVDVRALHTRVDELRKRRDGLAALLADGLLSPDAVREQSTKLTRQIDDVTRELDAATGSSPLVDVIGPGDVRARLDELPLLKLREVIRTLCEVSILPAGKGTRFTPEQVRIEWKAQA